MERWRRRDGRAELELARELAHLGIQEHDECNGRRTSLDWEGVPQEGSRGAGEGAPTRKGRERRERWRKKKRTGIYITSGKRIIFVLKSQ